MISKPALEKYISSTPSIPNVVRAFLDSVLSQNEPRQLFGILGLSKVRQLLCTLYKQPLLPKKWEFFHFVNIIGGKFAQHLLKRQYKIETTMPRTFVKVSEILEDKKDKKGVQVDFNVKGSPLTLFLTK